MYWYKVSNRTIDDTKLRLVTRRAGVKHYVTVVTFHALLEICSSSNSDEINFTDSFFEEIEIKTDIPCKEIEAVVEHFIAVNIINDNKVVNWDKYQQRTEAERKADNQKNYRERQKDNKIQGVTVEPGNVGNATVTPGNALPPPVTTHNAMVTKITSGNSLPKDKTRPENKTPLVPPGEKKPRKRNQEPPPVVGGLKNGSWKWDVRDHLTEQGWERARQQAPRWDIHLLADQYNAGITDGRDPPNNANAAFPAWCFKRTGGKSPP